MANKTINQLTEDTSPTADDFVAVWDTNTGTTKKVTLQNSNVSGVLVDESVTSQKLAPTAIIQTSAGNQTINSGTGADLTGITSTFTPAIASTALVIANIDWFGASVVNDVFETKLFVDGVADARVLNWGVPTSSGQATLSQTWLVALTAASHTLKLQSRRSAGSGQAVASANSSIMIILFGDANVTIS